MLRVQCDGCGHLLEESEMKSGIMINASTIDDLSADEHIFYLCGKCTKQFNEYFIKNKIGYKK